MFRQRSRDGDESNRLTVARVNQTRARACRTKMLGCFLSPGIERKSMSVESTLAELVRIDSRSSVSNLGLINHLLPRVEAAGLCARLFPYADEHGVKKFNLVAVHPRSLADGDEVELALVGHTDTVPFDPSWADALTPVEREGHSAYPSTGASAITRAARLITRIERVAEELKRDAHEAFDPPHTTVNVGLVEGGTAKNIIAGECRFTLEWRPVPGQRPERVAELVRREIETLRAEDGGFDWELSV